MHNTTCNTTAIDWLNALNDVPLPWLLEEDARNPEVRYFSLWNPLDKPRPGYNPKYRSTVCSDAADSSVEFNLQPTLKKETHEATF